MGDVTVQISRHRITFTPDGGEPLLLLDVGDCVDNMPELPLAPKTQTHELIAHTWVKHYSRGNAEPVLLFDVYRRFMSYREAQAEPLRLWRKLAAAADGTLRFQTAFAGAKSSPAIDWNFRATLSSYRPAVLTQDASPFECAHGAHIEYEFMVTDPQDANA